MSVTYGPGVPADREAIIDFINYVFSQAHRPHDFKKLIPKTYGDPGEEFEKWHFLAKSEKGIRACIAVRPFEMLAAGERLPAGFIGSVSVHPYARGEGHMKRLMPMAIEHAKQEGYAFLALGGQRQRYGYFGFDIGGCAMRYAFNESNAHHAVAGSAEEISLVPAGQDDLEYAWELYEKSPVRCLREKESFFDVCRTWGGRLRIVRDGGRRIGYYADGGCEIALEDEEDLPRVLKAILREDGKKEISVTCPLWEERRRKILYDACEDASAVSCEMIRVLDWEKVLRAMLKLRAARRSLADFDVSVAIDGTALRMRSQGGKTEVARCGEADLRLTQKEAHRLFFSLESAQSDTILPAGWLPLPFWMSAVDGF